MVFEDFSNPLRKSSGSLVWNSNLGRLQPSLEVKNWANWNSSETGTSDFDIGDGLHGVFSSSTYQNFGTVSGTTLTLNTDTWPVLKVTSFSLDAGWTLNVTGSQPLIIRSLGDVSISGIINCSGEAGSAAIAVGGGTPTGGIGRCGGGTGGNAGSNGTSGGATVPALQRGAPSSGAGGGGGGGGGAFNQANASAGTDTPGGGTGSAAGQSTYNDQFTTTGGGSGGGGGGVGVAQTGAGGGGGGGSILVYAGGDLTITATGKLQANGGAGGAASGDGGAGGGGGGGSVLTWSAKNMTFNGAIEAKKGAGGTSTTGGAGGAGADGRTWLQDLDGSITATATEDPITTLSNLGTVGYKTATAQEVISISFDSGFARPKFSGFSATTNLPAGSSATVEFAGSSDNFASGVGTWVPSAQLSRLDGSRYFKYRVTLTNTDASNPATVTGLSLDLAPTRKDDFEFTGACNSGAGTTNAELGGNLLLFVPLVAMLILPLFLLKLLRYRN